MPTRFGAQASVSAVDQANQSLSGNVGELLERLGLTNARLSDLIEQGVVSNLSEVDIASTSTEMFAVNTERAAQTFATSARILDTNASRLTDASSSTLKQIASIATRFDEQSASLTEVANILKSAQSSLSGTLEERQQALEALANGLVIRSEDIEKSLRSFEGLVGKTADKAEGRARAAAELMNEFLLVHRRAGFRPLLRRDRGHPPFGCRNPRGA